MSASRYRSRKQPPSVFYFEQMVIFFAVWHYWSWDVALLTAVALMALLTYIGYLGFEASNIFCQLAAIAYGAVTLFILMKAQASFVTCAVLVPMAAIVGYAVHFCAIAYQGISVQTPTTGEP